MFNMVFKAAETQPKDKAFAFTAKDTLSTGEEWNLTGTCHPTEDEDDETKLSISWVLKYSDKYSDDYFSGIFDKKMGKITGTAGLEVDVEKHSDTVFLSQQPAEVLVYRPHPTVLAKNKYISLWRFAQYAILHQVRRKMWSWSYFRDRRDHRKRYLELVIRRGWYGTPLSDEEDEKFYATARTMYPADARYLGSVMVSLASKRIHQYVNLHYTMTASC
jgi:hypothetical protein